MSIRPYLIGAVVAIGLPFTAAASTVAPGTNTTDFGTFPGGQLDADDNYAFEFTASEDVSLNFALATTGAAADLVDITFGISPDASDFSLANMSLMLSGAGPDPRAAVGYLDDVALAAGQTIFFLIDGNGLIDLNASFALDARATGVSAVPLPASIAFLVSAMGGLTILGAARKRGAKAAS